MKSKISIKKFIDVGRKVAEIGLVSGIVFGAGAMVFSEKAQAHDLQTVQNVQSVDSSSPDQLKVINDEFIDYRQRKASNAYEGPERQEPVQADIYRSRMASSTEVVYLQPEEPFKLPEVPKVGKLKGQEFTGDFKALKAVMDKAEAEQKIEAKSYEQSKSSIGDIRAKFSGSSVKNKLKM